MSTLYIKHMVCNRCILVVQQELDRLGLRAEHIRLGEVTLAERLTEEEQAKLEQALIPLGFELIDDRKSRLIEQIKTVIIELVHHQQSDGNNDKNLSDLLRDRLNHDYSYVSNLFSSIEGTTIEKYFIAQRIEKVKELLVYDELTLSEIADRLGYSSAAYLSNQFKKVTGLTPGHFREIRTEKRKALDQV